MYKSEDYSIQSPDFHNNMEDYILNQNDSFRLGSQEFNLSINELTMMPEGLLILSPPQQIDESTMDIANTIESIEFMPVSPRGPPDCTEFEGELNFQVEINASDTHKKKYLYSSRLNRIYVDMKTDFPVSFRWARGRGPGALLVRACAVFSDAAQREKRVTRCTQHTHDTANANLNPNIVRNVLHSSRSTGASGAGVYYCGRVEEPDSWYSVVVQLPPTTTTNTANGAATHAYQFVCKNSCSSGINRRAIAVIFTLEDAGGRVYGRRAVGARVCACPRRDLLRDEEAGGGGKRRASAGRPQPPAKRVKLELADLDDTLVALPPLQIVGVKPVLTGLKVILSMVEQAAAFKKNDPQATEKYTKCITSLRAKIDDIKKNL